MDKIVSFRNNRTYDEFKNQISPNIFPLFESLRKFCFSLGENVVEDVRMHRIVFCKSISFRWFADIEPKKDSIEIKIQGNRKETKKMFEIFSKDSIDELKNYLQDAYKTIR